MQKKSVRWVVDQGKKAKGRGASGQKAAQASGQISGFARIIYFSRFRSLASGATEQETALCEELAKKYQAKGQWDGEYSL